MEKNSKLSCTVSSRQFPGKTLITLQYKFCIVLIDYNWIVQVLQVYACNIAGGLRGKKTTEPVGLSVDCMLCAARALSHLVYAITRI